MDGAVHDRFDWQQGVVRCPDDRDEIIEEVVEPVSNQANENRSAGKVTVTMDEERLDDHPQV